MLDRIREKQKSIPITVKASTAYTVCNIINRSLSFITLPLFTRLLTTAEYGQYTVYTSWTALFSIFLTLNLAYGSFGPSMMKYEDRRDEYIASLQGISLLLSALFVVIYLPFRKPLNRLFQLPTLFVLLLVAEIIAQNAIQLWSGKKRYEFKYKSVVAQTLALAVLAPLTAYILVINSSEKGYARIFGYSITTIIFGTVIFSLNLLRGKKLYSKEFWKYALGFNLPLIPYYLSQIIFNQSDRIMISHISGTAEAGLYGVAYNLAMILTFILNAINNSYVPWLYGKIKEKKGEENKPVASAIAAFMAILILFVIWFAPEIISILAGEKYAEAAYVVPPVAMSFLLLFYTQLSVNIEFYYEQKKMLVAASAGAAVLNIVLNALLIPRFGYVAAGYTTLLSYIVFAGSNYCAMQKVVKEKDEAKDLYDIKSLLLIMLAFIAFGFTGLSLYTHLIIRAVTVALLLAVILTQYKKIYGYFKTFRSSNKI